jgi:hypothetical protein
MARIKRAYTPQNILNKKFHPLAFTGEWANSLGMPDKAFSAIIWGGSSSGKTEFSLQLARYLTKFGRVAYNSLEQGMSATMQDAIERNYMAECEGKFILLDREPFPELIARMKRHKSPNFLFVDSVQYLQISKSQYYELKELMQAKRKGIIWISQARGKEPKGALADDIRFDVDLKLWVQGFRMFPEGRLNGGGEHFDIWPERSAKYYGEIF